MQFPIIFVDANKMIELGKYRIQQLKGNKTMKNKKFKEVSEKQFFNGIRNKGGDIKTRDIDFDRRYS